jgi:hypothetical protein
MLKEERDVRRPVKLLQGSLLIRCKTIDGFLNRRFDVLFYMISENALCTQFGDFGFFLGEIGIRRLGRAKK